MAKKQPKLKLEIVPIADLIQDPANVRTHSERNLETIKASLAKFGQQTAIVIDENNVVVAGNGRLMAAKELGWDSLQCVRTSLTGTELTAYAIADNRTAELASWDLSGLDAMLESLADEDFAIEEIGFSEDEIDKLMGRGSDVGDEDEDEGPAEDESDQLKPIYQVLIEFESEEDKIGFVESMDMGYIKSWREP